MRSHLFIDRLSMTILIEPAERSPVVEILLSLASDGTLHAEQNRYSGLLKSYRYAFYLPFDEERSCSIQVMPRAPGSRFMRLEWNPANAQKVHADPMGHIVELLRRCVPSYSANLILDANITRIDLSFRLYRIHVDSLLVFTTLRKPVSGRYFAPHAQYDRTGRLNSMEIGRPDGDQYLLIYDKCLERENRQIGRLAQFAASLRHSPEVRRIKAPLSQFELRLRNIGNIENLGSMPNPFTLYSIINHTNAGGIRNDHQWQWFVDSCKVRGGQAALSMIENRRERTEFRNALRESNPPSWWNPVEIWREVPDAIRMALGLA